MFVIVGLLFAALLGGCSHAPATNVQDAPTARHEIRHARHPIVKKKKPRPAPSPAQVMYEDDDDDDDDEVGLAAPNNGDDPDDASPAPADHAIVTTRAHRFERELTFSPIEGLGPSSAHTRPDKPPPRA